MSAKWYLSLGVVLAAGVVAVVMVERQHINTRPSADALLAAAADAQHEMTRVPARFDRMSDSEEIAVGDAMAQHAVKLFGSSQKDAANDAAMQAYMQEVGARVALKARRKLPWTFHYVADPYFVNAFALPGGHVFVGEGLIKLMKSEDALAAVLGHEVEHVDLSHCAERAEMEARLRHFGAVGDLVGLPMEVFMAGYSKEQELEADRDGTVLAVEMGYSYAGILQLMEAFGKLEGRDDAKAPGPVSETAQLSLETLAGYFASHPPAEERAEGIRELAKERAWHEGATRSLRMTIATSPRGS